MKCSKARKVFVNPPCSDVSRLPREVSEHLQSCVECGRLYARWQSVAGALRSSAPVAAPPGLKEQILRSVAPAPARDSRTETQWWWMPMPAVQWGLAALLVATLGLGMSVRFHGITFPSRASRSVTTRTLSVEVLLPEAHRVVLAGDFNGWDTESNPLRRSDNGRWSIRLPVHPGAYQYLLLVDGEKWVLDPNNEVRVPDGFGGMNSGVEL